MGMRLIEGMAKGLSGTLKVEGDKRTCITVRFPFAKAEQPSPNGEVGEYRRSPDPCEFLYRSGDGLL
jgi:hypothetical protein